MKKTLIAWIGRQRRENSSSSCKRLGGLEVCLRRVWGILGIMLTLCPHPAVGAPAPVWAVGADPATEGYDESMRNGMVGWTFTVSAPVTVTGLGWYAQNPGGLSVSHEVGIWQYRVGSTNIDWGITNPPLLVSVVVGAGTNATLNGAYREVDLASPIILPVGYYVIGGTYASEKVDPVKYIGGGGLLSDPRILVVEPIASLNDPNSSFQVPDAMSVDPIGWGVWLGPNMRVIPQPSLQITRSGDHLVLAWALSASNFVLQTSGSLGLGANWRTATNAVEFSNGSFVATNILSSSPLFFRISAQ